MLGQIRGVTDGENWLAKLRFTLSRYDLVLAGIPTAFVVALLVGQLLSISPQKAILGATIVGTLAVVDALFINPPLGGTDGS